MFKRKVSTAVKKAVRKSKPKKVKKEVKTEAKHQSECVLISNTYGVTKYLDKEDYEKVTKKIKNDVEAKAKSLGWKKFTYEVKTENIEIVKR